MKWHEPLTCLVAEVLRRAALAVARVAVHREELAPQGCRPPRHRIARAGAAFSG
jgi:hypothetical protein